MSSVLEPASLAFVRRMDQVKLRDRLRGRMYPPQKVDRLLRLLDPLLTSVRQGAIVPTEGSAKSLLIAIFRAGRLRGAVGEIRRVVSCVDAVCRHDDPLGRVLMVKKGVDGGCAAGPDRVSRLFREVGENKWVAGDLDSYEPSLVRRAPDLPRPADLGLGSIRCRSER